MRVVESSRQIGKAYGSISGLYPFHGREPVAFESTLERDFLVRAESDNRVLSVTSQPVTLEYSGSNGRFHSYTPDYLVCYRVLPESCHPPILVEVKPSKQLRRHLSQWKPRFRAAIQYCRQQGYVFHLMDEHRIRDQRWENAVFLQRYRKMQFDEVLGEWVVANLATMGSATFQQLLEYHFHGWKDRAIGIAHLWHLIATGRITYPQLEPLNQSTELWVVENE